MAVVAECSPQPAVPAAVSKQMSESVPTPLAPLPKAPPALEDSQPALSRDAPLSALPSRFACLLGEIYSRGHTIVVCFETKPNKNAGNNTNKIEMPPNPRAF